MGRFLVALVLLVVAGCSNNLAGDGGAPSFCLHDKRLEDHTRFSEEVWGVVFECPGVPVLVGELPPHVDGRGCPARIVIGQGAMTTYDDLGVLLAHEVGHALGHHHTEDPCDVMAHGGVMVVDCVRATMASR